MKIKYLIVFVAISFAAVVLITSADNVQYPVKELGNCKDQADCKSYCDNQKNIKVCIDFAEKNNLMPPAELEEAKKVQAAIAKGVKPPACGNKKACDAYCETPEHMEECITFGAAQSTYPNRC